MKKTLLTGVAALFLATGPAHATENYYVRCGRKLVNVLGHHGYSFTEIISDDKEVELPARAFRFGRNGAVYFRGRKCRCLSSDNVGMDKCLGEK